MQIAPPLLGLKSRRSHLRRRRLNSRRLREAAPRLRILRLGVFGSIVRGFFCFFFVGRRQRKDALFEVLEPPNFFFSVIRFICAVFLLRQAKPGHCRHYSLDTCAVVLLAAGHSQRVAPTTETLISPLFATASFPRSSLTLRSVARENPLCFLPSFFPMHTASIRFLSTMFCAFSVPAYVSEL